MDRKIGQVNLTNINDPLNHSTVNTYDALNRLTQFQDPANNIAQYTYNALDQLTAATDPRNLSTTYTTDALGNVSQVQSPDTGVVQYTFDAAGNVKTQQDSKGQMTQYQYDALNRLKKIIRDDSSTVIFTYDSGTYGIGHLTGMSDDSGSTSWSYDIQGRVLQKTQTVAGSNLTTQYAYDTTGQLISATLPSNKVIGYTWTNGQVSALTLNGNPLVSSIAYQPFGGPISWIFANGETVTRSYDQDGRITATPISTLTYDNASRINGIALGNHSVLAGRKTYDYDALDRLTSFSDSLSSISYTYDANGNRATQTNTGGAANGSSPPSNDPITPINVLTYDTAGRLSTGNGAAYVYNGLGQRVSKNATATTLFNYDASGQVSGEYDSSGNLIEETIRIGSMPIAVLKTDGTYYVHADHLNTPRQIDNSAGQAVWAWDTFTFGGTLPNQDPNSTGTAFTYNLRHPGQYFDTETGLFQNGFRDYSPYTGRYVESDPIGLAGGSWSTYGYVDGNPVAATDPMGLAVGHHYVPRQVFNSYNFPPEAKAVFEKSTTGQVTHFFDRGHRAYNKQAAALVEEFLKKNNIDPTKMTGQQAQQCVDYVKESTEPSISDYLKFLKEGGGKFGTPLILCPLCEYFSPVVNGWNI